MTVDAVGKWKEGTKTRADTRETEKNPRWWRTAAGRKNSDEADPQEAWLKQGKTSWVPEARVQLRSPVRRRI